MDTRQTSLRTLQSPQGTLTLHIGVADSLLWYALFKGDTEVVGRSNLAIYGSDDQNLAAIQDTASLAFDETTFDETWEQPWGEQRYIRNNYRELSVTTGAHTVRFRLFDDGLGFRYELQGEGELIITKEETQFSLPVDTSAWWIPALGQNHYEHLYRHTALKDNTQMTCM
jgi:alpha-glucosidase